MRPGLEAQRAADRQRAAAQHELLAVKEQLLRIRHIVDYWQLSEEPSGTRRWHFVARNNTVKSLSVSEPMALAAQHRGSGDRRIP